MSRSDEQLEEFLAQFDAWVRSRPDLNDVNALRARFVAYLHGVAPLRSSDPAVEPLPDPSRLFADWRRAHQEP